MTVHPIQTGIPILMYHSISADAAARFRKFAVAPARFSEQMRYLAQQRYTALTVSQLVQLRNCGAPLPDRAVVLTFDDGFADFASTALPLLKQYGLTATLYLPTSFIGATSRWLRRENEADRQLLTWQQVIEVHALGIEIAAHSHQHAPLDVLPAAQANFEVVHCKQILEEQLGVQVASFAYPYGYYSAAVQRMVETAGYSSACAVRYRRSGVKDDVFALSRLIVPGMMELSQFTELLHACAAQINPHYERLRARLWQWARSGRQALQQVSQGSPNYEARSL